MSAVTNVGRKIRDGSVTQCADLRRVKMRGRVGLGRTWAMRTSWLRTQHRKLRSSLSTRAKSWLDTQVVTTDTSKKDACMLCGKLLRRHHNLTGQGRICSPVCAELWAESL